MIRQAIEAARSRFGVKVGAVLVTLTVIFFASNPEILSFAIVVNAIGADVFLLFVGFQLRTYAEMSFHLFAPIFHRFRVWRERRGTQDAGRDE